MTREEFEPILATAAERLGEDVRASAANRSPDAFQQKVFDVLTATAKGANINIHPTFHPHAFPDIKANGFGVEVKTTTKDSWLSVGNSVFEGMRDPSVKQIYVMFGKMGGMPSVKWGRYEDRVTHVRISHAPRFVIEMDRDSSLFEKMNVSYDDFSRLSPDGKMRHVREYSRARLQKGERLWWIEDDRSGATGIPLEVRLYMNLTNAEKSALRAEGALLFPQIAAGGRDKTKYTDVAFYFLKYRNVFCPQTRDLFTAGSVAGKERGGNYLLRALIKNEQAIWDAAQRLDDYLFEEYWGVTVPPSDRIEHWLRLADSHAKKWRPSYHLFGGKYKQGLV